jgi:8-oxo-dGTP diphosphatase
MTTFLGVPSPASVNGGEQSPPPRRREGAGHQNPYVFFRLRTYSVEPGKLGVFNEFFLERLLPVQLRHGAKLVGRFESAEESRIYALWAYDDEAAYEEIDRRVRADPDAAASQLERQSLDPLFTDETVEDFLTSTVPLGVTELAHLMGMAGRRIGAAAVLFREDREVLLVHHTYGPLNWELPGGASEPGEPVIETALRELREETGLAALAERLTGVYYDAEHDAHHFAFLCRPNGEEEPRPSSSEISECAYWPLDALPRPLSDFTVRRIEDALAESPQPLPVSIPARTWLD